MALRVATWNIRKAVGLDRRRDPSRVLSVIAGLGADIVALQEADLRLGPRRAALPRTQLEAETGMRVVDLADNDVSLGSHGNALLVAEGLEVKRARRIPLPGLEPRGAVIAEVEVPRLGGPVHIVGTHLGLLRRWRRLQLATILDHLPDEDEDNCLILGDFNEWHAMRGLEALESGFSVLSPGHSFHSARPVAALDRIAHGPGLRPLAAGVERHGPARVASDHLPVWAEFARA